MLAWASAIGTPARLFIERAWALRGRPARSLRLRLVGAGYGTRQFRRSICSFRPAKSSPTACPKSPSRGSERGLFPSRQPFVPQPAPWS